MLRTTPHDAAAHDAARATVDRMMVERNRQMEAHIVDFLAGLAPAEWGRVIVLHEFGDFVLRPLPNGYVRVSSHEAIRCTVRPVELLGQRELGRWFTLTTLVRNDLIRLGRYPNNERHEQ